IAWQRIRPLWHAAGRQEPVGQPALIAAASGVRSQESGVRSQEAWVRSRFPAVATNGHAAHTPSGNGHVPHAPSGAGKRLLAVSNLAFRYPDRAEPVLHGVGLEVWAGDRLLLEGRSGGGKSTLAALLAGCRVPSSGLILLGGLDRN